MQWPWQTHMLWEWLYKNGKKPILNSCIHGCVCVYVFYNKRMLPTKPPCRLAYKSLSLWDSLILTRMEGLLFRYFSNFTTFIFNLSLGDAHPDYSVYQKQAYFYHPSVKISLELWFVNPKIIKISDRFWQQRVYLGWIVLTPVLHLTKSLPFHSCYICQNTKNKNSPARLATKYTPAGMPQKQNTHQYVYFGALSLKHSLLLAWMVGLSILDHLQKSRHELSVRENLFIYSKFFMSVYSYHQCVASQFYVIFLSTNLNLCVCFMLSCI